MTAVHYKSSGLLAASAIAVALIAPLLIYFDTARSIVAIWNSSETFAHGYIILPISLWLIWKRRDVFSRLPLKPFWPALVLLAVCGFGWLLAELADVQVVRQYALVAMIPVTMVALLGLRISMSLAFPLLFLMLAVPFGDVFINPLINFTADFTVTALQLTGIPVLRDGVNFSIPSGNWSVVEACSGVRYLIASFTLGCLYAYLTYRSPGRRTIFVVLSIVVPIIANGIRAYMIVMIGHLSGMELAVGVDHLIYGWLFFGVVMFLMYWLGSFWREDERVPHSETTEAAARPSASRAAPAAVLAAALCVVISMPVWPAFAKYIDGSGSNTPRLDLTFRGKWQEAPAFANWRPDFFPAKAELTRFFERDGRQAGLTVLYYRNQGRGAGVISSQNRIVEPKDPVWRSSGTSGAREIIEGDSIALWETRIQSASGSLLVWHWYWIDGQFLANDILGKLAQAKGKILMDGDDAAAVFAFARYEENPEEARAVLRGFLANHLAPLRTTLAEAKRKALGDRDD